MSTFQTEMFSSKPIIPMRPPKYIKNPPVKKVVRIRKYDHHCTGDFELNLTATPVDEPKLHGYRCFLTCSACQKIVGEMDLPHGFHRPTEYERFINTIEED